MADMAGDPRHLTLHDVYEKVTALEGRFGEIIQKVADILEWQQKRDEADRVRREQNQKELWRKEWQEEQDAKQAEAKEESRRTRSRLLDRFYLLLASVDALAGWDLVSSWEHGTLISPQTLVAAIMIGLTILLLLLGIRL